MNYLYHNGCNNFSYHISLTQKGVNLCDYVINAIQKKMKQIFGKDVLIVFHATKNIEKYGDKKIKKNIHPEDLNFGKKEIRDHVKIVIMNSMEQNINIVVLIAISQIKSLNNKMDAGNGKVLKIMEDMDILQILHQAKKPLHTDIHICNLKGKFPKACMFVINVIIRSVAHPITYSLALIKTIWKTAKERDEQQKGIKLLVKVKQMQMPSLQLNWFYRLEKCVKKVLKIEKFPKDWAPINIQNFRSMQFAIRGAGSISKGGCYRWL
jgi:hypothetical protein